MGLQIQKIQVIEVSNLSCLYNFRHGVSYISIVLQLYWLQCEDSLCTNTLNFVFFFSFFSSNCSCFIIHPESEMKLSGSQIEILLIASLALLCSSSAITVDYDSNAVIINGERKIIFAGAIHYPRSTPEVSETLSSNMTVS